jgi:hypothetical protein
MSKSGIAQYLRQTFGLGDNPIVREKLYQRLQRLVDAGTPGVLDAVKECEKAAGDPSTRHPGRFFASVVKRRLLELGVYEERSLINGHIVNTIKQKMISSFSDDQTDTSNQPPPRTWTPPPKKG